MTTKIWTGSISTDWNDPGNWSPSGVPASGDDVVIGTTATSPALSANTTVNTITINGSDTLTLAGAATVLTVTNGITLSSTGGISGVGAVAAAVTASGAAHITATGGTLEVTGVITDSGGALVLTIAGASDTLLLDAASTAHTVTFGSSGTLELNIGAALTVGTEMAIGTGTLKLDGSGSTLTDAPSGVTISTGTISGAGTVDAVVTASGAAHITATGGTLRLTSTEFGTSLFDNGNALTLTIAGATDRLVLDGSGAQAHAVIFGSSGTLELKFGPSLGSVLTVGTAMAIGTGTLQLDRNEGGFADASGVTISTGTIIGLGQVAAAVTATGAAHITANGSGQLTVTGAITDSGNALVLTINGGSSLLLDAASAAHTVAFSGSGGGLIVNTSATLTVGSAMTIANGTLQLEGPDSVFTDASGVMLTGPPLEGFITGQGTVNANLSGLDLGRGSGTVTARGGTLHLTGTVASGPKLTIDNLSASVLSIENTATAAAPITINNANQTLAIGSGGNLTINGGVESITNGTIQIATGGQLSDSAGFTIGSGAVLFGSGKVTGAIGGTGIVEASGGTLELVSAIAASDSASFEIANSILANLLLDSAPGTGNTFTFLGAHGQLALADDTGFNDTISGLNVGSGGAKTNFVDIEGHTVTINSVTGQGTTSGTITLSDGAVLNLSNLSSAAWFANAVGDGSSGTDIFVSDTACYCRGTMILTETGEVPVENLSIGDQVITLSGAARPIKWIGSRAYDPRFVAGNGNVLPIRIEAGALAHGVPARDLWVSPEHAIYLRQVLVPAQLLVNDATITQPDNVDRLEYFHLDLGMHDVILAEGTAAESYIDCDNRGMFHNAREFARLYPGETSPCWEFCARRVEEGSPELAAIRKGVLARVRVFDRFTDDPDLHLVVDGGPIRPQLVANRRLYRFAVPAGSRSVVLASRSTVPMKVERSPADGRRLGVAVERIVLCGAGLNVEIEPDCPALCKGFHAAEPGCRWTDGHGHLPAGLVASFAGEFVVEVRLAETEFVYGLETQAAATRSRATVGRMSGA